MDCLFREDMTSLGAQTVLFSVIDGKTEAEREEIFAQYAAILPAIVKRETDEALQGWIT